MNLEHAKFLMQKTREDYDEISEEFSVTRKTMWPELIDLDKYIKEGDRVLDIGCGNGKLFGFLKNKNIYYTGMDVSQKLIRIAKENYKNECAEFKIFDGLDIECFNQFSCGFDVIYCLATLPHLPGEEMRLKFLRNLRKVAKPGAKIIITCWNLWQTRFLRYQIDMVSNFITDKIFGKGLPRYPNASFDEQPASDEPILTKLFRLFPLGNGGQYDWGDLYIPWHKQNGEIISRYYHAFTLSELNSILKKAGWEVEEIGYRSRSGKRNFNLFAAARRPMGEKRQEL